MAVSWKPSQKGSFRAGAYEAPGRDLASPWLGRIRTSKTWPRSYFSPTEGEDNCKVSGDERAQCNCHDGSPSATGVETRGWHWPSLGEKRSRRFPLVLWKSEAAHNAAGDMLPVLWCERTLSVVCGIGLSLV